MSRTHCCRSNCFPVCPRAQHLLRTQKMFLILFRNILCANIMGNNVSATMCPRLPGPLLKGRGSLEDTFNLLHVLLCSTNPLRVLHQILQIHFIGCSWESWLNRPAFFPPQKQFLQFPGGCQIETKFTEDDCRNLKK